ncbi:MAG: hypothetical protein V1825_03080 [Candidatus Falkowbacteria bacterium]
MINKTSKYKELGIDPGKSSVREIFSKIIDNDFPNAFVNIKRDPEFPGMVFTKHPDGDGSKFVQRALHYFETGDESIFQGAVDDALSMNTGDIAASGFVFGQWVITQVININGINLPKDIIMKQIALRVAWLLQLYRDYGFNATFFMGGETADLPDQTNSMVYDMDIYARAKETDLIVGNVRPGDKIYGFASNGQAVWEEESNSGLMSNGLTLARTDLMDVSYGKLYPFLIRGKGAYRGGFKVNDKPDILGGMTVSEAILSPTRQWAIVIRMIIEKLKEKGIFHMLHGISMNTGGGATKICHVGEGILYKKIMPVPPPIFQLIQSESGESWQNMFEDFNCGVGIDVVGEDNEEFAIALKEVADETEIKLFELGRCEKHKGKGNNIFLDTPYGWFGNY